MKCSCFSLMVSVHFNFRFNLRYLSLNFTEYNTGEWNLAWGKAFKEVHLEIKEQHLSVETALLLLCGQCGL